MENGECSHGFNGCQGIFPRRAFIHHFPFSIFHFPVSSVITCSPFTPEENTLSRRKRTKSLLTPVDEVLSSVMTGLEMPEEIELKGKVFLAWDDAAGDAAPYTNAFRFRGSTLIVEVTEPAWLTELSMRKTDILNRLERAVGERVVEDIKLEVKKKRRED
jgi:hypothetical protein